MVTTSPTRPTDMKSPCEASALRIAHLSDIHFYESADGLLKGYRHSPSCLRKIEKILQQTDLDLLIVTGDVSNIGDRLSLERVYQWIDDKIYIDGEYYGLRTKDRGLPVIVVPGNHDAFNAPTHGSNLHRWQSSLKNYHAIFHDQVFQESDFCVGYRWIEKGPTKLFVVFADSCFLGDPETEHVPGFLKIGKVAKGKFARSQTESIMKLYDQGVRGDLKDACNRRISTGAFLESIKVIAMHHYLFEPADWKKEPLLSFDDRKTVFQNLAMADFDILLCGHKHVADFQLINYLDHFDARGKLRLAHNVVRRSLGLSSLPLECDSEGRMIARMIRFVYGFITLRYGNGRPLTDKNVNEIIEIFRKALENKAILKEELLSYIRNRKALQSGLFDDQEVRMLHSRIQQTFSREDRKKLDLAARSLAGLVAKLGGRPFAHIMSGSSAKSNETGSRRRSFNIYSLWNNPSQYEYVLRSERYAWNEAANGADGNHGEFSEPTSQTANFGHSRLHTMMEG